MEGVSENRLGIRAMIEADIGAVHALTNAERWPHREEDLADMLSVGYGVVAEMGGQIVATTMWWTAGPAAATLGMVIVARTHRGGGLGRLIMEAALDRIAEQFGAEATVMLNATQEGLPLYRRLGFAGVSEILQHQGASFGSPLVPLAQGERIRPLGERDKDRVSALVEAATGLSRPATIALLFEKTQGVVLDHNNEVIGAALFRRFGRGYVIGPVVAPDRERAKALVAQWLGSRSGEFIRLDVTAEGDLGAWLEELGIVRVGRVVTMVRGAEPMPSGSATSFAIVSQALC